MSSSSKIFAILAAGDWPPGSVRSSWTTSRRRIVPKVERAIASAWSSAKPRLRDRLFDGPMCRLESFSVTPAHLDLALSPTSYRPFYGTHLIHPEFAEAFGEEVLANAVGMSALIESADCWLLLGRRNDSVAYHPSRVHPFAGSLEPGDSPPPDIFAEIRRELAEEISLAGDSIIDLRCIGMVRDNHIRQPELVFHARTALPRANIELGLDRHEHCDVYAIRLSDESIKTAKRDKALTPVAAGALELAFPE